VCSEKTLQASKQERSAYQKQILKAINDGVDTKNGLPILTENIQTDITLQIYVWMVYLHQYYFLASG